MNGAPVKILDDDEGLCCPNCGDPYLHSLAVKVFMRSEDDVKTTVTYAEFSKTVVERVDSNGSGNPSRRRHGLSIDFVCETCGNDDDLHRLDISQHKGCTHVEWGHIGDASI